jgi:hypothetical protein
LYPYKLPREEARMPLSENEQRELDGIEESLRNENFRIDRIPFLDRAWEVLIKCGFKLTRARRNRDKKELA